MPKIKDSSFYKRYVKFCEELEKKESSAYENLCCKKRHIKTCKECVRYKERCYFLNGEN